MDFHYVLLEKVYSHNLKDSSDIRFIRDSSGYLEGFYIKINNADSRVEAERIGEKKAKNLNNILTIKSGMTINARLSNFEGTNKNKADGEKPIAKNIRLTFSIKGGIEELDLNNSAISRLINEDTNPQLEYLNDAVSHIVS